MSALCMCRPVPIIQSNESKDIAEVLVDNGTVNLIYATHTNLYNRPKLRTTNKNMSSESLNDIIKEGHGIDNS
jgi:hypothetical protein